MKTRDILGLNSRNVLFSSKYNKKGGKLIANHKLLTKNVLRKAKLPIPKLYRVFRRFEDIDKFNFLKKLPESYVIKPDNSLGGEGILVIERQGRYAGEWITTTEDTKTVNDLKLLLREIIEGRFSMRGQPDFAFVEERIRVHPIFEKVSWGGTPDIGVVVFNRIPVMAFLRLPTKESGGRANMHQGAIACGIDISSGITIGGVKGSKEIDFFPGTRRKLKGIKIPIWDEILKLAINCQLTVPELNFMRVDIALQPSLKKPGKTFPKVLELNAQPGLKIQLANKAGLRRRLERVEGLEVDSPEKGIKIAKALFLDPKLRDIVTGKKTVNVFHQVEVQSFLGDRISVQAKVDTGAYTTSIDRKLAQKLGLLHPENILFEGVYKSALGRQKRPVVPVTFFLSGQKIKTTANISDRSNLKRPMIIGRGDLKGFLVSSDIK
ncbi:hypothetical protein COT75_04725 [Candidatus Beckwithbacteria bacterium CG10_big_fil_rev_8_21_14_0_10_34_10]|uniref:ATP-grasp domain-containing protein n=1 Tax=Candidatus Beckwithbacteria bacterium CG10_big_fil_rev_8_21_14_0_10_34_10 TaxID=1974495 RepID=A0A2H0WA07_9BACT|nr:MAG: hypothetical protein COT75_04725 [Candidatus Beckwithbacteria bacterium CG10_big_fil_rev_8_21_14_0_10_34_10]